MNEVIEPRWKTLEYSKSQVRKAGSVIKSAKEVDDAVIDAIFITDNWRAAHAYPMHVMYNRLRTIARVQPEIIVAERLKRLESIIAKLQREDAMSLWEMQDLGGCRFVVPNVDDVYRFSSKLEGSRIRHKKVKVNDYIESPKPSGYRSLHMVYRFHSDKNDKYNTNMLVEIQFRTHLQHVWATAVETLGLFTKQSLKAGQGEDDVKRFFALVSSIFAICEKKPVVPNTDRDLRKLIAEIKAIDKKNHYLDTLSAIRVAVNHKKDARNEKNGYYILILNFQTRHLQIRYFKPSKSDEANIVYSEIEKTREAKNIDVVLVHVSSFQTLKSAYPNYFSDINEFVDTVRDFLKGNRKEPCDV